MFGSLSLRVCKLFWPQSKVSLFWCLRLSSFSLKVKTQTLISTSRFLSSSFLCYGTGLCKATTFPIGGPIRNRWKRWWPPPPSSPAGESNSETATQNPSMWTCASVDLCVRGRWEVVLWLWGCYGKRGPHTSEWHSFNICSMENTRSRPQSQFSANDLAGSVCVVSLSVSSAHTHGVRWSFHFTVKPRGMEKLD